MVVVVVVVEKEEEEEKKEGKEGGWWWRGRKEGRKDDDCDNDDEPNFPRTEKREFFKLERRAEERWFNGTHCSCRGAEFSSQHTVSSQPPLTPAPGDLVPTFGLFKYLYQCEHTYTNRYNK